MAHLEDQHEQPGVDDLEQHAEPHLRAARGRRPGRPRA